MYVNGTLYKWYPKIREKDMNVNTSNLFVDTMNICNLYLKGLSGDYDGDQISVKGVYTEEANEELRAFLDSKQNFINLGGENIRVSTNEAIQSIYSLTKVLDADKSILTNPVF